MSVTLGLRASGLRGFGCTCPCSSLHSIESFILKKSQEYAYNAILQHINIVYNYREATIHDQYFKTKIKIQPTLQPGLY